MPTKGMTKVRARSRLFDRFSDVSEGAQSGKLGLGHWVLASHQVLPLRQRDPYAGARWLNRYPSLNCLLV